MSGWLANALRFEKSRLGDMWEGIKKDPKRLVLGVDPLSTGAWNAVLGRNDQPIVGDFGGPTQANYDNAEAKGIPTGSAQTLNGVAKFISSFYGGQAAGAALGGAGAGAGAAGGGGTSANMARYAMPAMKALGGAQPQTIQTPAAPAPMQQHRPMGMGQPISNSPQPMNAGPGPVQTGGDSQARRRAVMAQILRGGGGF